MKHRTILILEGDTRAGSTPTRDGADRLAHALQASGHRVEVRSLRELDLGTCTGCWHCWIKTPGVCSQHDAMEGIYRAYLRADLVVFATPLVMGFASALTKRVLDRLIPLGHPNVVLIDGECRHVPRYQRYPALACLLEPGPDDVEDDVALNLDYFRRTALHFGGELCFAALTTTPIEEVTHALDAA